MKKIYPLQLFFFLLTISCIAQQRIKVDSKRIILDSLGTPVRIEGESQEPTKSKPDVTLLASPGYVGDTSKAIRLNPSQLVWKDVPPPLPPGAKVAVLEGSPKESGMFTIRFDLPPNWQLPAHWHPGDERVTVLSGSVYVGFGEKLDNKKGKKYSAGSFYINPAGSHHYVYTGNERTVLQITSQGPWDVHYIEEKK